MDLEIQNLNIHLPNNDVPVISVWMVTYNHENYISEAVESVIKQETNFNFKLYIGEDCSTDKTREICKALKTKYPNKIELFLHKKNIGANANGIFTYKQCFQSESKYIALIEGDDYWTDKYKLQKQVDFLEANEEYCICFHPVKVLRDNQLIVDYFTREVPDTTDIKELIKGNFMHTASVIFRNNLFEQFPEQFFQAPIGDYFLYMLVARYGKIKKLADTMAVYRVHSGGAHSLTSQKNKDIQWLTLQNLMIPVFTDDVRKELLDNFIQNGKKCLQYDNELSIQTQIQNNLLALHPNLIVDLIQENEKLKSQLNSGQVALEILKLKFKNRLIQLMPGLTSKKRSVTNL